MKILIMGFTKIKYMPYLNFYLDSIDAGTNEVHVLYWNRDLKEEKLERLSGCVLHEFRCYQEDDVPKFQKIKSFLSYRSYVKRILEQERFDRIFVLHSLPGVLVADHLIKKYSDRYVLDYRDSTYEGFRPFRNLIGRLVENSVATFVSSRGFMCYMPEQFKDKIYVSHNLLMDSLSHRDERTSNAVSSDKIRIAFWGFVRHVEINKVIIEKIAKDDRFELHYYGREQQQAVLLKKYAMEIGARNVFFHGEYLPEDRYRFVRSTDLIHNIYDDGNMRLAMANKYYDGIIFRIPQLCMQDSYMAKRATQTGTGFSVNPMDENFTDQIYAVYMKLNAEEFAHHCDLELQQVLSEYNAGVEVIHSITSLNT